jgi:hypothetical protein
MWEMAKYKFVYIHYMYMYSKSRLLCVFRRIVKARKVDVAPQALVSFKKYMPPSSLLQGKHLPFTPSPLRLNIFRLFVILSLSQLYRYTPEIFLFSTATFKYTYWDPLRRIGQDYSAKVAW